MVKKEHYLWLRNSICKNYSYEDVNISKNYILNSINQKGKCDIKQYHDIENNTKLSRNHFHIFIIIILENNTTDIDYVINKFYKNRSR